MSKEMATHSGSWPKEPCQNCFTADLKDEMDFTESSFFKIAGRKLPSPSSVKASHRGIVTMPEMQLLIKYGPDVSITEAATMQKIKECFGSQVPVPEVFGWRVYQSTVFIYMELIGGVTLEERWSSLDFSDKVSICTQLHQMLSALRGLQHEDGFIGSITHGPLLDRVFYCLPKAGPFESLQEFYKWLEWLPQRFLESSQRYEDPYLSLMPKASSVKFTHADVHRTNIMVSTSSSGHPRVLALIDWGQSGWYPDYWEYFKMCYTTHWEDEWCKHWIEKMVEPLEGLQYLLAEYTMSIGAV